MSNDTEPTTTTPISDEDRLAEIKQRAEAAAPGPWEVDNSDYGDEEEYLCADRILSLDRKEVVGRDYGLATEDRTKEESDANAAFIAAARSDVPWLVERLEEALIHGKVAESRAFQAEARVKELAEQLEAVADYSAGMARGER